MRRIVLATVVLGLVVGCSDAKPEISTDIGTRDFRLYYSLRGTPDSTSVTGSLVGPGSHPRLVEGDYLELRAPFGTLPIGLLDGQFALDVAPAGGNYEIVLVRPPGRGGELSAKQYLPPPFTVTVPATASRAAALTFTWDAGTGPYDTKLGVSGSCVAAVQRTLASDVGTYTFNPFELSSSATDQGACTVTVEVVKGPSLASTGYYGSTQTTRVTLEMTP